LNNFCAGNLFLAEHARNVRVFIPSRDRNGGGRVAIDSLWTNRVDASHTSASGLKELFWFALTSGWDVIECIFYFATASNDGVLDFLDRR